MSLTNNDRDLSELLGALCDGSITPEQFAQLEQLLSADPKARDCYVNYMMLCGELKQIIPLCPENPVLPPSLEPNRSETHVQEIRKRAQHSSEEESWETNAREEKIRQLADESFRRFKEEEKRREQERLYKAYLARRRQFIIGISSLAALLAIMLFVQFAPGPQTQTVSDQPVVVPVVATVTDLSEAQWKNMAEITKTTELKPGSMTLEQGYAQLTFKQGAQVLIQAPCTFELQSFNKMALENGSMTANVPPQAVGFTVQTPWTTVVDYGTEFGVSTGQTNGSEVHVFKGKVSVGDETFSQFATRGQVAHVDQAGHIELKSLDERPSLFVRQMPRTGSRFGIPGKRLDLADVVGGGNGFGTGTPGRALDPSKNNTPFSFRAAILRSPLNNSGFRVGSGFIGIEALPFIDGIFVPNGSDLSTTITSTDLLFQDCPDTHGTYYDGVVCGAVFDDQRVHAGRLAGHRYETSEQPSIGACANVGITFDLDSIR
ncbi:MAG: FecR domain-containing protein, partial [Phycisphaeraceae bacterium]|nr:FecR domain-containing protein [Phycisphaeraceae bacterium]